MGENNHGFKEVVPGVLVSGNVQMKIPHPDPVWLIYNQKNVSMLLVQESLCVFSSEEKAESMISKCLSSSCVLITCSWDELVEAFGEYFNSITIDYVGEPGFFRTMPLRKDI